MMSRPTSLFFAMLFATLTASACKTSRHSGAADVKDTDGDLTTLSVDRVLADLASELDALGAPPAPAALPAAALTDGPSAPAQINAMIDRIDQGVTAGTLREDQARSLILSLQALAQLSGGALTPQQQ